VSEPYARIIELLEGCGRVLVSTHVRPDGDALGSSAAMVLGLRAKGIDARVLLLSHLPRKYAFLFEQYAIEHIDAEERFPEGFALDDWDALVIVDTGTWSQLPGLQERIEACTRPVIIIDHHLTQESWGTVRLVDSEAAAAGEIVGELLQRWRVPLDPPTASALWAAISSDTGWFQFSNTRPGTLRLAAALMEHGVDTDGMYQALYQNERAERVKLLGRITDAMQLLAGGRLAVMEVLGEDLRATGAHPADTENLINIPLQIGSVGVSMLITEPQDRGPVRISLRSKGRVDVASFAEQFGGGGHARASGLKIDAPYTQARDGVIAAMLVAMA
jgi:bifunctional oligoribonuclease and PAP phosphatase NrnA